MRHIPQKAISAYMALVSGSFHQIRKKYQEDYRYEYPEKKKE